MAKEREQKMQVDAPSLKSSLSERALKVQALRRMVGNGLALEQKNKLLKSLPEVSHYLSLHFPEKSFVEDLLPEEQTILFSLIACGEADLVLRPQEISEEKLKQLLKQLVPTESFYDSLGGIVGYYAEVLKLLTQCKACEPSTQLLKPQMVENNTLNLNVHRATLEGILSVQRVAEIYVVGGTGDRLNLIDPQSKQALPVAVLPFDGVSLLEGLFRDLNAREYLYYKLTGKRITIPVALMTSTEKGNHDRIIKLCEACGWFGRPQESIRFFQQPLVPVVTGGGHFSMQKPGEMNLKPGGHGALWKLARDHHIFDWFLSQGYDKALIRQINNPVSATDYGSFSFIGEGVKRNASFGFSSCERLVGAPEGMNVLIEKEERQGFSYSLTNVEYTEFAKKGLVDQPSKKASPYSAYPCNTNIIFVDLKIASSLAALHPVPGALLNMKQEVPSLQSNGSIKAVHAGRLESTMQNLADYYSEHFEKKLPSNRRDLSRAYITYNQRRKTISTTKQQFQKGGSLPGTPQGAFYDQLKNKYELLTEYCDYKVPPLSSEDEYCKEGPNWLFSYHPTLGPLYAIIGQKLRKGKLHSGAELLLEVTEVDSEELELQGSLLVRAVPAASTRERAGRITLSQVKVVNKGIDRQSMRGRAPQGVPPPYWTGDLVRHEAAEIILHGDSELTAHNIVLSGPLKIEVPSGYRLTLKMSEEGKLEQVCEPLGCAAWGWDYKEDAKSAEIFLKKRNV
jgi:hypothetical protein